MVINVGDRMLWSPHSWQREGKTAQVLVKVLNKRDAFGRTDYLVEPVEGVGSAWAQESTLDPVGGNAPD